MATGVEVEIIIDKPIISDLHETISSLIEQVGLENHDIFIHFQNHSSLPLGSEIKRLEKKGFHVVDDPTDNRFHLLLTSGDTISKVYLYKALYYLSHSVYAFVCPEYTLQRIESTDIITIVANQDILINVACAPLVDREKLTTSTKDITPRAKVIKDTCVATHTTTQDYNKYIRSFKKELPVFEHPLFLPIHTTLNNNLNIKPATKLKVKIFKLTKSICGKSRILKKAHKLLSGSTTPAQTPHTKTAPYISNSMRQEIDFISNIKYSFKGYQQMRFLNITYEKTHQSEIFFSIWCKATECLQHNEYDYIMVLPWLISGGVDLFAINYANTIATLQPETNILVLLTNNEHKSFTKEDLNLKDNITILNLPLALKDLIATQQKYATSLIYSIIRIFHPERVHIMASKAGYDTILQYGEKIRKNNVRLIFSSYNYLIGSKGEYIGYTVQELPMVYQPGDIITTDNMDSRNLWINQYGFIDNDILVHQQLFDTSNIRLSHPTTKDGINILWAAHIRPEKNPTIVPQIATALKTDKINIDCYGLFTSIHWDTQENPLEANIPNLHYLGPYSNFFTDINTSKYDLFLYTSHADGTPNVLIEAALSGIPIVSSSVGGIPDLLQDKAFLVQDSYSVSEFVKGIRHTITHLEESKKKASLLQNKLIHKHNYSAFEKQVKEMLQRSKL